MSRRFSPTDNVSMHAAGQTLPISPRVGEMAGRTEGGAKEYRHIHQPPTALSSAREIICL